MKKRLIPDRRKEFSKDYPLMSMDELTEKYNMNRPQVKSIAIQMALKKDRRVKQLLHMTSKSSILSPKQLDDFKHDYFILTTDEIIKKYSLNRPQFYRLAQRLNLKKPLKRILSVKKLEEFKKDYSKMTGGDLKKKYKLKIHQIKYLACKHKLRKDPAIRKELYKTSKTFLLSPTQLKGFKRDYPTSTTDELIKKYCLNGIQISNLAQRFILKKDSKTLYIMRHGVNCVGEFFMKEVISPPSNEVSYIAGFYDGEGSFMLNDNGHKPNISVTNTNKEVIDWIGKKIGCKTTVEKTAKDKHKTAYRTRTYGIPKILKFCELLIPHLIVRKKQAELLKEWCEIRLNEKRHYTKRQKEIYKEIKKLNNRRARDDLPSYG